MKRDKVIQFIIAGLIILILLIQRNVNADKKGCEKATDLAEQGAKNNLGGYTKNVDDILEYIPIETHVIPNIDNIKIGDEYYKIHPGSTIDFKTFDSTGRIKSKSITGPAIGEITTIKEKIGLSYFKPLLLEGGFSIELKTGTPKELVRDLVKNGINAKDVGKVNWFGSNVNLISIEDSPNAINLLKKNNPKIISKKVYYIYSDGNIAKVDEKIINILKAQNPKIIL